MKKLHNKAVYNLCYFVMTYKEMRDRREM